MGYYTDHELTAEPNIMDEEFAELFHRTTQYWLDNLNDIKWCNHDEDMIEISKLYPDVLFTLDGNGEDVGDIWRTYYKNGKMQETKANIVFDKFDETKLK